MFRPNLENPANKESTAELNRRETQRTEDIKDVSISFIANNLLYSALMIHNFN